MTQKLCPACAAPNALENRFCGRCGSRLEQPLVAPRRQELTIGRGSLLPAPTLRQVGRAAAASLVAIAAEAGLAWLRRRAESVTPARQTGGKAERVLPSKATPAPGGRVSAIFGRRVVRRWQQGRHGQETVEEEVWWYES
ncbi:MAG: zinc ribbon domain-containing protein [Anaerolineae bacterium]|nr:zinc ribbon domain-containing protein [Anaerolineae bacterium]